LFHIGAVKAILFLADLFYQTLPKSGTTDLLMMPLSTDEFNEIRVRKGRTFLINVNEITSVRVP